MKTKTLAIVALLLLAYSAVASAQSAADAAAEAAGSYLGAIHILQASKKTQCGYALLMDIDDFSRKAEQDVLNTLPIKYKKDMANFIPTLKQQSPSIVAKSIKDLDGRIDEKTRCGLVVGTFLGNLTQYWTEWEQAKKRL